MCSICLDKPLTHAVMPCGHKCMCGDCADKLTSKVCPICKDEYIKVGQIYALLKLVLLVLQPPPPPRAKPRLT